MLYELLTGRVPFDGEAPISIAIKHDQRAPGAAAPAASRGIPPALEAVVLRALEKDPARRYQSAEEFIAALEHARRAPTRQVVMEPTPGEPWVEEERAFALVGVGARRRSRWSRSAVGAYFLLAGNRVDVPNLVGREAERGGRRSCTSAGWRSRSSTRESDDVPRDEVISQDPEAGDGGPRGLDGHRRSISGGRARCPSRPSRASRARTPSRRCATPASRSRSRRRSRTTCPRAT